MHRPFAVNTSDPTCAAAGTSPYDCVKLVNGVKNGPFRQGLSDHIADSPPTGEHYYCKNNWTDNNHGGVPIIPADDSRLIAVFVMPYGSTDTGNPLLGSGYVPIQTFATFYVTGFEGDPCSSDDPAPPTPETPGSSAISSSTSTRQQRRSQRHPLRPRDSLGRCVAVMTK